MKKINKKLLTVLVLTAIAVPTIIVTGASLTSCSQTRQKNYAIFSSLTSIVGANGNKQTKICPAYTYDVKTQTITPMISPIKIYSLTQSLVSELQKYTTE